ncbi:unnamed protein product [Effrenium voratum]|nr:unnamed protein product [Effrenium voratum]
MLLLRELVAAHQDLHWTQLCELQCGCSGILREVHRIDRSAKLEPCILKDGAVQALQGVQWLPIEALEPLHHELPELTADDGGVVDSKAPADASAKAARERDEEWTVSSGRTFPLDVVVLTMSGAEIRIKVASLGDRLEDLRGKVAAAAKKDHLQVMLSSDGQMLPEEGTLEKIADLLAQEASLQLVIQPRQLRPGVVKRLQKESLPTTPENHLRACRLRRRRRTPCQSATDGRPGSWAQWTPPTRAESSTCA